MTGKPMRGFGIAAVAIITLACGAQQGQTSATQTDVGVTKDTITIGGTFPVSGPATAYYSVAKGADAYFEYTNAHGGIGGRKIKYTVVDDAYSAANTPAKARELVQDDQVFLTYGDLGTPNNLAVRDYYNQQKVPQLFVFTGSSHWGADYTQYPWTLGWQPDYVSEGKIYAKYMPQNESSDKIGILYHNDDYGKDYVNGLKQGLGDKASSMTVMASAFSLVDVLKKANADGQLTRKHVMDIACCGFNETNNPLLLPGEVVNTTKTNHFPIQEMQLEKWQGDHWVTFGQVIDARK